MSAFQSTFDSLRGFPRRLSDAAREVRRTASLAGAAMLAVRCGVPILPVYISEKKKWFGRTPVIIGEPYYPETAGRRATTEEYHAIADDMMARVRALKAQAAA